MNTGRRYLSQNDSFLYRFLSIRGMPRILVCWIPRKTDPGSILDGRQQYKHPTVRERPRQKRVRSPGVGIQTSLRIVPIAHRYPQG